MAGRYAARGGPLRGQAATRPVFRAATRPMSLHGIYVAKAIYSNPGEGPGEGRVAVSPMFVLKSPIPRGASISRARPASSDDRSRLPHSTRLTWGHMLRALTMLCLGLTSVGGWQMTALPVPSGHAHCASSQASARQAVTPQMCSYDHLSSEFQARRRHPRHAV